MTHVGYVNKDKHAAKAAELLEKEKNGYIQLACDALMGGTAYEDTREQLARRIKRQMKTKLFNYLQRSGIIRTEHRRYCDGSGLCRTYHRDPEINDVPSYLLNIEKILPNFSEIIESIMVEAGKLKVIVEIEAATKNAHNIGDRV